MTTLKKGASLILSSIYHSRLDKKQRSLKEIILQPIDDYGVDGDFVESQAFAFLAIRNIINEPISFPDTTGCSSPTIGGTLIKFK